MQAVGGAVITPDGQQVELSAEEAQALLEAQAEAERERRAKLGALILKLEGKRDDVVKARREIESRWIDDQRQFDGQRPRTLESKRESTSGEDDDTPPYVHHTRSRTNLARARIRDMLFPANDQAWDIGPTESPEIDHGGQLDPRQVRDMATAAAERMKDEIADQLTECRWPEHGRKMIDDACLLGIGVLKGPFVDSRPQTRFRELMGRDGLPVTVMETEYRSTASVERVDPWHFFPDMAPTIEKAEFVFQHHLMGRKELLDLRNTEGFDEDAIKRVLKLEPDHGEIGRSIAIRNRYMSLVEPTSDRWSVWEYHGPLGKDELDALGLEVDDCEILPNVEIWFCQGEVLMCKVELFESDLRLPYYVFPYEPADDTMFAYGVPYLLREPNRSIQASWEIALLNAAVSSGGQTIFRDGKCVPMDGNYRIRGPKLWRANSDYNGKLEEVFYTHIIPNNGEQHLAMFDRSIQLADDEIQLPAIVSGNPTQAVPTYGGLLTMMNASNVVQRRAAIAFDDNVIVPMITRMYWWNMIYNPRRDIRGDFQVKARGTSVLLFKDIQTQHMQVFTQMAADPRFAPYIDNYELLKANTDQLDIDSEPFIRPREEVEGQEPQIDPATQAQMEKNALEKERIALEREKAQKDAYLKELKIQRDSEREAEEQNTRRMEAQARLAEADANREVKLADIASRENMTLAQLQAKLGIADRDDQTKRLIGGMNARVKAREMALKLDPRNVSGLGI